MSKDTSAKRSDVIADEAADWFVSLQEPGAQSRAEFAAWLKTSPEHVREFLEIAALWEEVNTLQSQPSVDDLVAMAITDADDSNVVSLGTPELTAAAIPRSKTRPEATAGRSRWAALAAAAVVLFFAGMQIMRPPAADPNLHTTMTGEQRSLPLPDGSIVTLNTQSTLRVAYSDEYRDVILGEGEALFDVAKDTARPFRVITEHAVVQAVGTQFNVHQEKGDLVVTVVEGIVDVNTGSGAGQSGRMRPGMSMPLVFEPQRLMVGQQATVASGSSKVVVAEATIDTAIAWQERRLVFDFLPLREVIAEFNRYNDPPLTINDSELDLLPISGVFRSNDRESFVQFLQEMHLAKSTTRADGTIVLQAVDDDS